MYISWMLHLVALFQPISSPLQSFNSATQEFRPVQPQPDNVLFSWLDSLHHEDQSLCQPKATESRNSSIKQETAIVPSESAEGH